MEKENAELIADCVHKMINARLLAPNMDDPIDMEVFWKIKAGKQAQARNDLVKALLDES